MSAAPEMHPTSRAPPAAADGVLAIGGVELVADFAGALHWPEHGLLVVADLHL
jgi:hypothetical protein